MSNFDDYVMNGDYNKIYNHILKGNFVGTIFVEDQSDQVFWSKIFQKTAFANYDIKPLAILKDNEINYLNGKRNLEAYYKNANESVLVAVDSDFDYLCPELNEYASHINNDYVVHTFAYSRESVVLEKLSLSKFFNDIKYNVKHDFNVNTFIDKFSEICFDSLVFFVAKARIGCFEQDEFHNCFHLLDKTLINSNLDFNYTLLEEIKVKLNVFFMVTALDVTKYEDIIANLSEKGIEKNNAYRFISGHVLEGLICKLNKDLKNALLNKEIEIIKQSNKSNQISSIRKKIKNFFDDNFNILTKFYHQEIIENDEIYIRILNKIPKKSKELHF